MLQGFLWLNRFQALKRLMTWEGEWINCLTALTAPLLPPSSLPKTRFLFSPLSKLIPFTYSISLNLFRCFKIFFSAKIDRRLLLWECREDFLFLWGYCFTYCFGKASLPCTMFCFCIYKDELVVYCFT